MEYNMILFNLTKKEVTEVEKRLEGMTLTRQIVELEGGENP